MTERMNALRRAWRRILDPYVDIYDPQREAQLNRADEIRSTAASVRLHNAIKGDEYLKCVCLAVCHGIGKWPPGCKHGGAVRAAAERDSEER